MLTRLATKRDINGNRYLLIIDHEKKIYSRTPAGFFHISDYIEITKKDYKKYLDFVQTFSYKETNEAL